MPQAAGPWLPPVSWIFRRGLSDGQIPIGGPSAAWGSSEYPSART